MRSHLMTASRAKDARACPRLHHLKYEDGYRPLEQAEPLRFGNLSHGWLEAWWRAPIGDRLNAALAFLRGSLDSDVFEVAKAEAMACGYDARWADEKLETIAVEMQFETPLVNPATGRPSSVWKLAGKIDVVVKDIHGRLLLIEHKTSSEDISPGSEYWKRLRMDGQVSIYYEGAQALGINVEGCLYDVLKKPGQKPLKATPPEARKYVKATGLLYAGQRETDETAEEYRARCLEAIAENPAGFFARGEVVRLEEEMADAMHDVWQLASQVRESENAHRCPRNVDACTRFGRTCSFFPVCSGEASIEDPHRYVRLENVHPELSVSEENV